MLARGRPPRHDRPAHCPSRTRRRPSRRLPPRDPVAARLRIRRATAGLLAWIVEKFREWTDPAAELPEDAVDRDRILTDVSIYWFTATAGAAAHTYYERFNDPSMWRPKERSAVPTAVAVFPTDVSIRPFAERASNVTRWSEFGRGGHFAALEAPDLLSTDVRKFFRDLTRSASRS